jgi:hypothetical protein
MGFVQLEQLLEAANAMSLIRNPTWLVSVHFKSTFSKRAISTCEQASRSRYQLTQMQELGLVMVWLEALMRRPR